MTSAGKIPLWKMRTAFLAVTVIIALGQADVLLAGGGNGNGNGNIGNFNGNGNSGNNNGNFNAGSGNGNFNATDGNGNGKLDEELRGNLDRLRLCMSNPTQSCFLGFNFDQSRNGPPYGARATVPEGQAYRSQQPMIHKGSRLGHAQTQTDQTQTE